MRKTKSEIAKLQCRPLLSPMRLTTIDKKVLPFLKLWNDWVGKKSENLDVWYLAKVHHKNNR